MTPPAKRSEDIHPRTSQSNSTDSSEENSSPVKLQPLTAALLECVKATEVVEVVVERGIAVLDAIAGLVALATEDGESLEVIRASGYSPEVMEGWYRFPLAANLPLSDAVRDNTVLLFEGRADWRARYPELVRQIPRANYLASASLPLSARGRTFGALHFSFPIERGFTLTDQEFLSDLARQCALAIDRALLLEQAEHSLRQAETGRDEARVANRRLEFLTRAGTVLGESLDYQSRLTELAHLCVPDLADWAGVDVLGEDGQLVRLAVAHRHPEREAVMREIQLRYPPKPQNGPNTLTVIETGERLFFADIPQERIERGAADPSHARLLRLIGVRAALCLPLTARGRTLGAITLGMGPAPEGSGRQFTPETVAIIEELARRAAVAVDNARLFVQGQRESAAREEERRRTEAVLESIGEMFYALNSAFQFTYVNRRTEEVWGKKREELLGRNIWDVMPQVVGTVSYHAQLEAMRERRVVRWETISPVLNRWIECTCYAAEDGGISIYFREIQEKKEAEQALRASESRYRHLLDTALEGILFLDANGNIALVNQRLVQMLRYNSPSELIGQAVFFLLFPDDRSKAQHSWAAWREGVEQEYELRLMRKDGSACWAIAHVSIEREEQGNFRGTFTMFTDITERRRAEEDLRISENRFRALADNIGQLAWMADASGVIFWYNRRWFEYTGTTLEQMQGRDRPKVHHPDYKEAVTRKFREHVVAGEVWEDTFPIRGADGQYRWFLSRAFPTKDESGKIVLWCGTNTDVTEQRASEMRAHFLADLTERTRSLISLDAIIQETVRSTGEFLGLLRFNYNDVTEETGACTIKPEWGWGKNLGPSAATWDYSVWGESTVADLKAGRTVVVRNLLTDSRTSAQYPTLYEPHGMRAVVRIPIRRGGKWVALLSAQSATERDWSGEDVALLETVTQRMWVALENARLLHEEQEATERQRRFVREMLASVTEGRLCLCGDADDLPAGWMPASATMELTPPTLRRLRKAVAAVAEELHFPTERAQDLLTAVGEAGMNAVRHGGGGMGRVFVDTEKRAVQVWIQDHGKGIREEDLHRATLEKGWSGGGSLGHGFFLMLRTCDRTYLLTGARGTTVVLEQEAVAPQPAWFQPVS